MEDLNVLIAEVDARSKSNTHRLDKLERRQDELDSIVRSVAVLATEQEHIKTDVAEIKQGVIALQSKSGKRWDAIVDKIIFAVVGGVVAYMLIKIGF